MNNHSVTHRTGDFVVIDTQPARALRDVLVVKMNYITVSASTPCMWNE